MTSPLIGIDLGTRYAMAAYCPSGQGPVLIPNRWGEFKTPSVVCWENDRWYAGEEAMRKEFYIPDSCWWDIKRKLSSDWAPIVDGRSLSAQEILVPLLSQVREDCEATLKCMVTSAVITVPAHFSFLERSAMARVARNSGFENVRIINEPTAAAMACARDGRVLVVDFGAGTFDVSVLEVEGKTWQVLESLGDSSVGGIEIDVKLAQWMAASAGLSYENLSSVFKKLILSEAERVKCDLSFRPKIRWQIPTALSSNRAEIIVTRGDLERLARPVLSKAVDMVSELWNRHGPESLLLVGGSSRIPLFRDLISRKVAIPEHISRCPDEVVALGAAVYASNGEDDLLIDVLSESLGVLAFDGTPVPLLKKGHPLPARASKAFKSVGSGTFRLSLFQGDLESKCRVIACLELRNVQEGEKIELDFSVNTGGLLHVKASIEGERVVSIAPLDLGMSEGKSGESCQSLNSLERQIARMSLYLSNDQQIKVGNLFRQVRLLKDMEPHLYEEALKGMCQMTSALKDVTAT